MGRSYQSGVVAANASGAMAAEVIPAADCIRKSLRDVMVCFFDSAC